MKNTRNIFVICLLLFGCAPVATQAPVGLTPISTSLPLTSTGTPLQTNTPMLVPTQTVTPRLTLEPDQARTAMKDLLWNNEDCLSPCFMDMVTQQTGAEETASLLNYLGLNLRRTSIEHGIDHYSFAYRFDSGLALSTIVTVKSAILENFQLTFTPPVNENLSQPREWVTYSPETLISKYGNPSEVSFVLDWGEQSFFEMDLYFKESDLIVQYVGEDIIPRKKGPAEVCPSKIHFRAIRVWIGENPLDPPVLGIPLEAVTNMTINEFSNAMLADPNHACFTLDGTKFP